MFFYNRQHSRKENKEGRNKKEKRREGRKKEEEKKERRKDGRKKKQKMKMFVVSWEASFITKDSLQGL